LKTISTLRPHFFDGETRARASGPSRGYDATSVDLGHLYWRRTFDSAELAGYLDAEAIVRDVPGAELQREIDLQAVRDLRAACSILGAVAQRMPSAAELLFCFRILAQCGAIASRRDAGFAVHFARGLVCTDLDQYRLSEILRAAAAPEHTAVGRLLATLLVAADAPEHADVVIINLRNDGELVQAFLLAALYKQRSPETVVILDTSGANEQYNFGQWVPLLRGAADEVSRYIDYFLPRQDYKATLHGLLDSLAAGIHPRLADATNAVRFSLDPPAHPLRRITVPPIERSFGDYIRALPVFHTAGRRTIVARLSPARCHWAACKFCTINSQHLMPRGLSTFGEGYQQDFDVLAQKIRDDRIESVVLMDEALHPNVLLAFARLLLAAKISIVYRARCRFTNDLTEEASRLIYASGCRYLGLGLEAASPRINRLVNKHMGAPIEYDRVLEGLEAAGVRTHIYAILGFPTETQEEIAATRDFLIENIRRYRYLTVSANRFYLMRGSGMADEPGAFGIERVIDRGDVALVLEFVEPERDRNRALVDRSVQQVFQAEFLPDLDEPATAEAFWHFIDQTGIFYLQKVEYPKNPFHALAEARHLELPPDYLDRRYEISHLFWVDGPAAAIGDGLAGILCDWITLNYHAVPDWMRGLLSALDPTVSLRANVERHLGDPERRDAACHVLRELVLSGLLVPRPATDATTDHAPPAAIFLCGGVAGDDGRTAARGAAAT
jgi:hypothetical protein